MRGELALCGHPLPCGDQRLLAAFAANVAVAYSQARLAQAARCRAAGRVRPATHGTAVQLTPKERKILDVLLRNRGKLVAGDTLLTAVRGPSEHTERTYLRIYRAQRP